MSSADFIQRIISRIQSECQTVWIQIKTNILLVLIWVQTVCKGCQQTTKSPLAWKELNVWNYWPLFIEIIKLYNTVYVIMGRHYAKACIPKISHLHQRRFCRIYLSTNHSPHDPQNLLLAQTNRPMKTPGRIFSIIPSCQSD